MGNLYLPDLNGDIIDNGVVKGDTDYILRVGALMLVVTAVLGIASVAPSTSARGSRWASGATFEGRSSRGRDVLAGRGQPRSDGVAHHPQHERRPQVQTVVFMGLTIMVSAPILIVGGIIMALRTDSRCPACSS